MSVLTTLLWGIPAFASFALLILLIRSQERFASVTRKGWARVVTGGVLCVLFCLSLFLLHLPVIEILLGFWSEWVALAAFLLLAVGLLLLIPAAVGWLADLAKLRAQTEKRISAVSLTEDLLVQAEQPYVLTELLTAGLGTIMAHAEADAGMVWLIAPDKVTLILAGSRGFEKPALKAAESVVASGQELFDRALKGNQVITAGDLSSRTRFLATFPGMEAFSSVAVVPLSGGSELIGMVLVAASSTYHFTPELVRLLAGAGRVLGNSVSVQRMQRLQQKLVRELAQQRVAIGYWEKSLGGGVPVNVQTILHGLLEAAAAKAIFLAPRGARHVLCATDPGIVGLPMDGIWSEAASTAEQRQRPLRVNPGGRGHDPRSALGRWIVVPTPGGQVFLAPEREQPEYTQSDLGRIARLGELALLLVPAPEVPEPHRMLELAVRLQRQPSSPEALAKATAELVVSAEAVLVWEKVERRLVLRSAVGCDPVPLQPLSIPVGQGTIGRAALAEQPLTIEASAELGRYWAEFAPEERKAFAEAFGGLERPAAEYIAQVPATDLVLQLVRFTRGGWSEQATGLVGALLEHYEVRPSIMVNTVPPGGWEARANDLNNIFTGILGQAELLGRRLAEMGLPELEHEGVDRIVRAAQAGGDLVHRLAVPEPRARDEASLDKVAAGLLAGRHITDDLYLLPDNRAVQIHTSFEPTPAVSTNRQRIQDVLWSALSSVTQERSTVSLGTSADERYLYLAVGTHESKEPLNGPFGDFFRAPDLAWNAIMSPTELDFLRTVGAQIAADDHEQPKRLVVRFPIGWESRPDASAHPGLNVLAIDDQEIIRDLLLNMFMGMGHRITVCKSGEEGMKALAAGTFDLVLTDLGMPGMSGWEVAQAVKDRNPDTPVVLITGWGFNFAEEQVRKAGVDYVLTKPFRLEHLTEVVESAVRRSPPVH